MKQLAESIRPGDATLFLLMKEMTTDKVVERIKDGITVFFIAAPMRHREGDVAAANACQEFG